VYGHVNNVIYYAYFDSAANRFLIEECGLDIQHSEEVGFVVASSCEYHSPIKYPSELELGFRVNQIGTKSVQYGLAVFVKGASQASATGCFTHVFVNRAGGQAVELAPSLRAALELALFKG